MYFRIGPQNYNVFNKQNFYLKHSEHRGTPRGNFFQLKKMNNFKIQNDKVSQSEHFVAQTPNSSKLAHLGNS